METIRQGTTPAWLLTIKDRKGREKTVTEDWDVWAAVATADDAEPVLEKSTGDGSLTLSDGKVVLALTSVDTALLADATTYNVYVRWKDNDGVVEERNPVLQLRGEETPLAAKT